jgi:hypothetical protein
MSSSEKIQKQFADQALICERLGSPFTARLLRLLAARLDASTLFGRRIFDWPGDPYGDNLALRAAGRLGVRSGSELSAA